MDVKESFKALGFDYRVCATGKHLVSPSVHNNLPDFEFSDELDAVNFLLGFVTGLKVDRKEFLTTLALGNI